jgi:predicted dehydrogenase
MTSKLRWGVLGTGNIVGKGGPALQSAENGEWLGIAGRTPENGRTAAIKYGVHRSYDGYRELLADPDIDAVYIALLNHLHMEMALEAIRAGKHVLLEKPFALNAAEAETVVKLADRHGAIVEEAFIWRHMQGHTYAREAVATGQVGEPVFFRGHFSFQAVESSTRLVEAWGGGALYDIGCYLTAWSRYQFAQEPEWAECRLTRQHGDTGVDRRFAGTFSFPNGGLAHITGGLDLPYGCGFELRGTNGELKLQQFANPATITVRVELNGVVRDFTSSRIDPFRLQAERFAERVFKGDTRSYGAEEILAQAQAMDALFAADRADARIHINGSQQ